MNASLFNHVFWDYYIVFLLVAALVYLACLLWSQTRSKPPTNTSPTPQEWDGIQEQNHPMPKWWCWLFVLLLVWAAIYLVAYPALGSYAGLLNWSSQAQHHQEVTQAENQFSQRYQRFANMDLKQVAKVPEALQVGQNLFQNHCIQCHGIDARGMPSFPDLTDNESLWGQNPEDIQASIAHGRFGVMPAYATVLPHQDIADLSRYVATLSQNHIENNDSILRGKALFHHPVNACATCHGEQGRGIVGMGPSLQDEVWLWGQSETDVYQSIAQGRQNSMPAWEGFLTEEKLHILSAYVWQLSQPIDSSSSNP